jgi:photosystem II stability/assembly factor-like uncharacterized protein
MKAFVFLALFYLSFFVTNAQWMSLSPYPSSYTNMDIAFPIENTGWIVGVHGTILFTRNGGDIWENQECNTVNDLFSLSCIDEYNVWTVGDSGTILQTQDAGMTWMDKSISDSIHLMGVHFINHTMGWAVGKTTESHGIIISTSDSGGSWTIQNIIPHEYLTDVFFNNSYYGWVVGQDGIYFTSDGGLNWTMQFYSKSINLNSIYFLDSLNGWGVGSYKIVHTSDSGSNWSLDTVQIGVGYDIQFTDAEHGWIAAYVGEDYSWWPVLFKTMDGGITWEMLSEGTYPALTERYNALYFSDNNTGWVVGEYGYITHFDDGEEWINQSLFTNDKEITDISFIDSLNGWALANNSHEFAQGMLLKTNDGGGTWNILEKYFYDQLHSLYVIDETNLLITGEYGSYRSQDGGDNWAQLIFYEGYYLLDMYFINKNIGWAIDFDIPDGSRIYKTSDQGESWVQQYGGVGDFYHSIFFIDQSNGWVVGRSDDSGIILNTTNGGETWSDQLLVDGQNFTEVDFYDSNNGWTVDLHGSVFKTTDGGQSWNQINEGNVGLLHDIFLVDSSYFYAVGNKGQYPQPVIQGLIFCSNDGGLSWTEQTSGTSQELHGIWFNDAKIGWIVGLGGTILHTNNGGMLSVYEPSEIAATRLSVILYPNPFSASTTMEYEIRESSNVILTVHNHLGQQVESLTDEYQQPGKHKVVWNASGLPSGIYFYRLIAGNESSTGKLVVVR